jgi:hypothetical protein
LDDKVDVLAVDVGINDVQKARHFRDDVKRLDVVRLLSQIVLNAKKTVFSFGVLYQLRYAVTCRKMFKPEGTNKSCRSHTAGPTSICTPFSHKPPESGTR